MSRGGKREGAGRPREPDTRTKFLMSELGVSRATIYRQLAKSLNAKGLRQKSIPETPPENETEI